MGNGESTAAALSDDELRKLWNKYDRDKTGTLDLDECELLLNELNDRAKVRRASQTGGAGAGGSGPPPGMKRAPPRKASVPENEKKKKEALDTAQKGYNAAAAQLWPTGNEPFECPHCKNHIVYSERMGISNEFEEAGRQVPLHNAASYNGMWAQGRTWGPIPPSFFSSPYNTHTWAFR
uniref:EF-hand domain-containing protein n=1 Tax=Chromera velia CCMP2878 TaxID=1169474 RepID=A0A0G4F0B5_9ALVE|eukprot:Cvel_14493.t1-p1 / transcript=Cvel_14493.t1 / gene=Cvel_14493 / organism=Chromera_velia_CCMP2878 / gene_product=hypothetical protein / transcript_product=hypothetical protein / location=Cvel_scaffold1033:35829-38375(-) / protein_length=178 / sequence_SO=supercontig / SO=protein_coding / is_pseudo=false